ncbi:hypothetical protein B0T26DRAFT_496209 [Lasiosphaeria miniovina]|uniref:Uncharacterized protein n=1 Tax=Lasiosphaeria miniovina TaxID=1954250 RepID=A0AA39ZTK6_9PEZI|nr:uncharacterized protein B0T26DRAFT_496209 [Lasiosphaeria miniovina]KAK0703362.1 hypothetical protein B0T26DRAFT_496209 [Lasiosphaeria miniovina]
MVRGRPCERPSNVYQRLWGFYSFAVPGSCVCVGITPHSSGRACPAAWGRALGGPRTGLAGLVGTRFITSPRTSRSFHTWALASHSARRASGKPHRIRQDEAQDRVGRTPTDTADPVTTMCRSNKNMATTSCTALYPARSFCMFLYARVKTAGYTRTHEHHRDIVVSDLVLARLGLFRQRSAGSMACHPLRRRSMVCHPLRRRSMVCHSLRRRSMACHPLTRPCARWTTLRKGRAAAGTIRDEPKSMARSDPGSYIFHWLWDGTLYRCPSRYGPCAQGGQPLGWSRLVGRARPASRVPRTLSTHDNGALGP